MHPWNGRKYSTLNDFGYDYFSAYYTIDNKPDPSYEYQPDDFLYKLIEENHEEKVHGR